MTLVEKRKGGGENENERTPKKPDSPEARSWFEPELKVDLKVIPSCHWSACQLDGWTVYSRSANGRPSVRDAKLDKSTTTGYYSIRTE